MSPEPRPTSVPSGILIHPTVRPQYTNITDRQDNGPIAYGEPLLVMVAQKTVPPIPRGSLQEGVEKENRGANG